VRSRLGSPLVVLLAAAALSGLPATAARAAKCASPEQGGGVVRETPWPQLMLAPERAWPFARGSGVTVAVLDSGTDRTHPQLAGAMTPGFDLYESKPGGDSACNARGTAIATMIAGRGVYRVGFRGFAPGARILPVRIADQEVQDDQLTRPSLPPDRLADGITWAADHGATVINVSTALYYDSPKLRAAVKAAYAKGALVVAPAGDKHGAGETERDDPVPFPAAYPQVLGVCAVDATGHRAGASQVGSYVDVCAPGVDVLGGTLAGGYKAYSGTGYATAFVSATVALIRSADPGLSPEQVTRRLKATASPAPGGQGPAYGAGIIDPYRAVTETVSARGPVPAAPVRPPAVDPAAVQLAKRRSDAGRLAGWMVLGAVGLGVAAVAAAVFVPLGRRRRWRPGVAPVRAVRSLDDEIAAGYHVPLTTVDVFQPRSVAHRR
jgi:membrane-anchored mycosin MYCP